MNAPANAPAMNEGGGSCSAFTVIDSMGTGVGELPPGVERGDVADEEEGEEEGEEEEEQEGEENEENGVIVTAGGKEGVFSVAEVVDDDGDEDDDAV